MSTKCEHCKGTHVEPGEANCTWCDNTGTPCGLGPLRFTKGDTDPAGDCDKFEAGIHVGDWFQRVVVYGDSPADAEALRDEVLAALEKLEALDGVEHARDVYFGSWKRTEQERYALQQRLTAADERADVLETALRTIMSSHRFNMPGMNVEEIHAICFDALTSKAALKLAEGGGDEYRKSCEVVHKALSIENQRITPVRFKCLACGEYHEGSGNLPCPSMSPYSRIEQ